MEAFPTRTVEVNGVKMDASPVDTVDRNDPTSWRFAGEIGSTKEEWFTTQRMSVLRRAIERECNTVCDIKLLPMGPDGGVVVTAVVQGETIEDVRRRFQHIGVEALTAERYAFLRPTEADQPERQPDSGQGRRAA